ncbi:hypothetical protein [Longimicrobium sp.]|uniref:hypothetical protein n=1 Tax=Longimicrobium sp. TaxID=2029185 RepID=UPI002E32D77C|nr:hypothetical protein [Longimicrobium sp.]HEX6041295.1 hypothetical protein [Longimicrobium sp.]
MRKLNLSLDDLAVESFEPVSAPAAARGTVHGNDLTEEASCNFTCTPTDCGTCVACNTVEYTCGGCDPRPTLYDPTCGEYTCFGDTCPPAKTCYPPE